jgi:hypothetical protein
MTGAVFRRYFNLYRLAAYVLVFFAAGHTLGALVETPRFGPASDTVVAAMKGVTVQVQGASATWYGFYRGFGWNVSVFFLFSAFLCWYLGGLTAAERRALAPLTWALFLSHAAGAVIAWVYFFPVPIVCATLVAVLLGIGCLQDRRAP